ncbi:hypothetical protein [Streptococcus sanguinis]|uniref:hypothetical protein n=1 Tax=Streptococcus sanguinis TaxID=1305 RepID=UPI001CC0A614|nr:hypothetical protein [Streptococcus sanguinis]MBZ2022207.1 hypothetical protein [Streptococcus sanguinis]
MAKSETTIALENELAAIEKKMEALKAASSLLEEVSTNVPTTKDDMESLHVAGQKYDEEYDKEQDEIKNSSNKYVNVKTNTQQVINEQLIALALDLFQTNTLKL